MLNYKTEVSTRNHNLARQATMIRLNQLISLHADAKPTGLKPSGDIDSTKPIYEIQLHSTTLDASNSVQYIMESFRKIAARTDDAVIYKLESGFKSVFFKH